MLQLIINFKIASDFDRVYFSIYIYVEYSRHEEGRSPHAILLNLFFLENPVRCAYYEKRIYCYKQQVGQQAHALCILPVTNILLRQGPCMSVLLKGSITPTGAHYHYLSSFKRYMNGINCYWDSLNLTPFFKMFSEMQGES